MVQFSWLTYNIYYTKTIVNTFPVKTCFVMNRYEMIMYKHWCKMQKWENKPYGINSITWTKPYIWFFFRKLLQHTERDLTFNNRPTVHQTRAQQKHKVQQLKHFHSSMLSTTRRIIETKTICLIGRACGKSRHTALQTHRSRALVLSCELVNSFLSVSWSQKLPAVTPSSGS